MSKPSLSYKDAGVDINAGNELVERIKPHVKRTTRPEVIGGLGGFGALCAIPGKYKEPILVSGTDGVGTCLLYTSIPTTANKLLIAFSGGLDSTALLSLVKKLSEKRPHLSLRAIHIHHGLSPNADTWTEHCQQLCEQFAIPLVIEKVKVEMHDGIEAGAREARYQAISTHIQPDEYLITAHHLNDQTETFFLALRCV